MNDTITATYTIPEGNLAKLQEVLARISKRAAKLNLPPVSLHVGEFESRPYAQSPNGSAIPLTDELRQRYAAQNKEPVIVYRRFYQVTVTGETPRLAGWAFMGTIQHMEVDGQPANILATLPGTFAVPERFRTATASNCDHCHTDRNRKDTYLVVHEDGTWKQIGRKCTQDFLGNKDPHEVTKYLEYLRESLETCRDSEGSGGYGADRIGIQDYLARVAGVIREEGWRSKGTAYNMGMMSTATAVIAAKFFGPPPMDERDRAIWKAQEEATRPTEVEVELAQNTVEYVRSSISLDEQNDYLRNLKIACSQADLDSKLLGIVASAIQHYKREVQRIELSKISADFRKADPKCEFVGTLKKREVFQDLQVTFIKDMGNYMLVKLVDGQNRAITLFGLDGQYTLGDVITIKATPKQQSTYKEQNSTIMGKAVVVTAENLAKELKKVANAAKRAAKKAAQMETA
jgi:hypothetical protein